MKCSLTGPHFLAQMPLVFLLLMPLSACGKNLALNRPNQNHEEQVKSGETIGTITKKIKDIHDFKNQDPCEAQYHDIQLEIATVLDSKIKEIKMFANTRGKEVGRWKRSEIGPLTVRSPKERFTPENKWISEITSWSELSKDFQELKDTPVDAKWVELLSLVNGIVDDDYWRLKGLSFYLHHDEGPLLSIFLKNAQNCLADPGCGQPKNKMQEIVARFGDVSEYREIFEDLQKTSQKLSDQRKHLARLEEKLWKDSMRFEFTSDESVKRINPLQLQITLDPTVFEGVQDEIAKIIESIWKSDLIQLKVQWITKSGPEIFKLIFEPGFGGRSIVTYKPKQIHLFNDVRSTSIAHEVGHALGFRDRYYTIWDKKTCSYITECNYGDLMSDQSYGSVLPEDFVTLSREYPVQ